MIFERIATDAVDKSVQAKAFGGYIGGHNSNGLAMNGRLPGLLWVSAVPFA